MEPEQQGVEEARVSAVRFSILLAAFFALLCTLAFSRPFGAEITEERPILRATVLLTFLAVVGAAAFSLPARPLTLWLLRTLAGLTMLISVANLVVPSETLQVVGYAVGVVFLGSTAALISIFVLRAREADYEAIAASLCAYMILGVLWALVYTLVDILVPGSFAYNGEVRSLRFGTHESASTLYFSYVTLTTLGLGDFTPKSDPARILTAVEAIVGQLFLVVLVARLVGMSVASPRR